ncbi:cytochrome P450 [Xylariomycetidae sp. FL0641]|nr:cytochrome P450 [Xylariomycetidae sp. FL0641]
MLFIVSIIGVVLATTYILLHAALRLTQDASEPPSIADSIPFITPILNMAMKGESFHRQMRDEHNLPIYTLRMPATNVIGVSKATGAIIGRDVTSDSGYLMSFPKYVHSALSAGPALDAMNRRAIQVLSESLNAQAQHESPTINLFQWVRHELLLASTDAVYGPKNPFRDSEMEKAWYTFEPSMMMFALNLYPRWFARKGFKAREYMVRVWERYFDERSHEQGSEFIKARVKINDDFQIPLKETARIETGGSQAILTNTPPGAFWLTYHIFSDPVVLQDVRAELLEGVQSDDSGTPTIDLTHVKSSCPILLSTIEEMMRMHSTSTATRIAMDDYRLEHGYLLKKGSTIMMPSSVQHTNRAVWGDSVDEFRHKRFVRVPGVKGPNPVAFRGFGGGTTLCPGRHFASTEMLMFTAQLVLQFDLQPEGTGWVESSTKNSPMIHALPVPDWDIRVQMRRRDKGNPLRVLFSGYERDMEIAAEDVEGATPDLGHRP